VAKGVTLGEYCRIPRCCHPNTCLQELSKLASGGAEDPLHRFFAREAAVGKKLLGQIRKDLTDVIKVCEGSLKQTNHLRNLLSYLTKGTNTG
jgi:dynein heavy chain 1